MNGVTEELRYIIHLDMDAFYASVEVLDNPDLRGKPVIVGGIGHRGVVSAASYEAREFGVHSAQPIVTARKLCPHGVYLPVRMRRYKAVSDRIFEVFRRYTPLVEPLSLDEAFLDVTGSLRLFGPAEAIAREIKQLVKKEIGLTVSAGVAPSKLVAKIASDLEKPDGLTVVPADQVESFLARLPISRLWGVGRATRKALGLLGVETIGDMARLGPDLLERKFGEHGRQLALLTRGIDGREVSPHREVKSIGAEETFPKDITSLQQSRKELLWLVTRAARRMRRKGFLTRTITLKVKYSDFRQTTRAETIGNPTDEDRIIFQAIERLLEKTSVGKTPVRLLGVSLSGLGLEGEGVQGSLFDDPEDVEKGRDLDRAADKIVEKYGDKALVPATLLGD
jgi:DNA polymerase-4